MSPSVRRDASIVAQRRAGGSLDVARDDRGACSIVVNDSPIGWHRGHDRACESSASRSIPMGDLDGLFTTRLRPGCGEPDGGRDPAVRSPPTESSVRAAKVSASRSQSSFTFWNPRDLTSGRSPF